jgi:dienelactone hydrolase
VRLSFALVPMTTPLDTVRVRTRDATGFAWRRSLKVGQFITAEDIQRENPRTTSALIRTRDAMRYTVDRYGNAFVAMSAGPGKNCKPFLFLDGFPIPAGAAPRVTGVPALDWTLHPDEIGGVEIYVNPAQVPAQFRDFPSESPTCGVVVFWTRETLGVPAGSWQPLAAGSYAVGFRVENLTDAARPLPKTGAPRRLQLSIWYPARREGTQRLTYGAYVALASAETTVTVSASDSAKDESGFVAPFTGNGVPVGTVHAWLAASMLATRDAEPLDSRHPMVVIAQGNGESAHDQAALAEYLASHGYVVATCPSQTRISDDLKSEDDIGRSAEDEADDLAFVISRMSLRADTDKRRIAVIGHSFGARGALLLAMRRRDIGALVSLDGGIGTATGLASFRAAPSFTPDSMRAPVLHVYETLDSFMKPDWTLLKSIHNAPVWIAEADAMHHHHFTSLGGLGSGFATLLAATGGTEATTRSFVEVATAVREFLDAQVGNEPTAFAREEARPPTAGSLRIERLSRP